MLLYYEYCYETCFFSQNLYLRLVHIDTFSSSLFIFTAVWYDSAWSHHIYDFQVEGHLACLLLSALNNLASGNSLVHICLLCKSLLDQISKVNEYSLFLFTTNLFFKVV